jgi:magnesium chelatase subunit I
MSDEILPFPLLAMVGQAELKTALVITLINPQVGGVLLIGPYGVGKTTAVRGLLDVMPLVEREELDDNGTLHPVQQTMRLVELPLNARIEDVVGGVNERVALEQQRVLLEEGILARAHRNLLYIDEINLLEARVVDVILDAAAQGRTLVRRGPMTRLFPSQFVLIGSMNPEEGSLRPQIMDRFGLRVWVAPLSTVQERLEAYHRAQGFRADPAAFRTFYAQQTDELRDEIAVAREILPYVVMPPHVAELAAALVQELHIPSHRAEIALLEAARARAAADFRNTVIEEDVQRMAPLALRERRSSMLTSYAEQIQQENSQISAAFERITNGATSAPAPTQENDDEAERTRRRKGRQRSKVRDLEQQ